MPLWPGATRVAPGMIRRAAFTMTESDIRRWLLLLAADRVQVVEGVVDDLAHGHEDIDDGDRR